MNKLSAGKASVLALIAVFAVSAFLAVKSFTSVFASGQPQSVIICHATGSDTNPYVTESPNIQNDGSLTGGHLDHTGPVFPSPKWGDIIPPYTHGTFVYAGLNWTADGQAIWNNGCNIPGAPTPTPTPTGTPAPTCNPDDEVCSTPTPTPTSAPQFHSVCREFLCVLVDGAGTNSCATDTDCSPAASPTPLVCSGDQHLDAAGTSCVGFSGSGPSGNGGAPQGQVLGASTMASTGSFAEDAYLAIMAIGGTLSAFGIKKFAKA